MNYFFIINFINFERYQESFWLLKLFMLMVSISDMIKAIDSDGDGKVNYKEFLQANKD